MKFPNLRIASVENGAEFLPDLVRKVRSTANKIPGYFPEDPVEIFRQHVWINPFWEDDLYQVVDIMGADRVIFGSDWPHIEALPEPLDYLREVKDLSPDDRRKVLHDNARELLVPARPDRRPQARRTRARSAGPRPLAGRQAARPAPLASMTGGCRRRPPGGLPTGGPSYLLNTSVPKGCRPGAAAKPRWPCPSAPPVVIPSRSS